MSTMTVSSNIPLTTDQPAHRLRRMAAAVRVAFTWWGVRRALTTQQKEELGSACDADSRLLTASKKLVDVRHEAFRKLTALRGRISSYWRGISLPYVEAGIRLIRQSDIDPFVHVMEGLREELHEAEGHLNAAYDAMKADARQRLGRLFNPSDYPTEIQGLFDVQWDFPNVEPPNYLLRINPQVYEEERARVASRFEEAVRLAEQSFAAELGDLVDHLTERLAPGADGHRKVFRDSAVTNFMEFFERFQRLNVSSNAQLDELVGRAQSLFRGVTAEKVRSLPEVRQQLHNGVQAVRQQLDQLVIDAPRRRIIRSQPSTNGASHATGD